MRPTEITTTTTMVPKKKTWKIIISLSLYEQGHTYRMKTRASFWKIFAK